MKASGAGRLLLRQARADVAVLITLAVLVLVTALLAAAVPRQLDATADAALREALTSAPNSVREITARSTNGRSPQQLDSVDERLTRRMSESLTDKLGTSAAGASTGLYDTLRPASGAPFRPRPYAWLQLRYQAGLLDEVRWVQGRAPGDGTAGEPDGSSSSPLAIALDQGVASTLDMRVGDRILLTPDEESSTGGGNVTVVVSGLFVPDNPTALPWGHDPLMLSPGSEFTPAGELFAEYATGLVDRDQLAALGGVTSALEFDWHYPLRTQPLDATNVAEVLAAVEQVTAQGLTFPPPPRGIPILGTTPSVTVTSGVPDVLRVYVYQAATAQGVAALVLTGLFVLALLVLGLATQLSIQRRRLALALARDRGASPGQLVGVLAIEAAMVAVPAALAGYALAVGVVPDGTAPLSVVLVILLVLGCVAFVALGGWRAQRAGAARREDVVVAHGSKRRAAAEVLVVLLAVGGLILLRRRGVGDNGAGGDPFLATVPVLLALSMGVLALRAYPLLLRPLVRLVGRGAGVVSFLSLARAVRQPFTTTLPLAVLLLGLGFSVFASAVETTVDRGQEDAAWRAVGADFRLESSAFRAGQVARISSTAGVTSTVSAFAPDAPALVPEDGNRLPVRFLAVDPVAYSGLLEDAPTGLAPRADLAAVDGSNATPSGVIPALVSPGVAAAGDGPLNINLGNGVGEQDIRVVGVLDEFPTDEGEEFVVVDLAALRVANGAPVRPTELYVDAPASAAGEITQRADDLGQPILVTGRAQTLADISHSPFVEGTVTAFRLGSVAAAGYCLLAMSLTLVLTAHSRTRLLAALRTLGVSRRQARSLMALELTPMVAVVVLTGLAVGVALPYLLVPVVDLTPFTGGSAPPVIRVDPLLAGALALGLVVVVTVAAAVTTGLERQRRLGEAARIGVEP